MVAVRVQAINLECEWAVGSVPVASQTCLLCGCTQQSQSSQQPQV